MQHGLNEISHDIVGFERGHIEGSIVSRFEAIARDHSNRIAISQGTSLYTYDELNRAANQVAHAILAESDIGGAPIPLILAPTASAVVGALGVLKARRAYSALDPSIPECRLSQILRDLQPVAAVTDIASVALVQKCSQNPLRLILVDKMDDGLSKENPDSYTSPALAAIFYTSGSTGQPKGVQHDERTILQRIWWETNTNQISRKDRISLLFSLGFTASIPDLFDALLNGATLCLYDVKRSGLDTMAEWLTREQVTLFHIPVAVARQWLDSLPPSTRFTTVRHLVLSGQIYRTDLDRVWKHFPNCKLLSHFAASETLTIAQMIVTPDTKFVGEVLPIGYPVEDKEVVIVDDAGTAVSQGQAGEIAVRSRYLSTGYWRRPELTAKAFLPEPDSDRRMYRMGDWGRVTADGYLEYLGRRDAQIKIRGYRVDITEVEGALHRQEMVKDAAVVAFESRRDEKRLIAYVVPKEDRQMTTAEDLRSALSSILPDYMVPARFSIVHELPRTDNGKLDAKKLPAPGRQRPMLSSPLVLPQSPLEAELADLWGSVLGLDRVGIDDRFFDLGGDSLLAIQLASRIFDRYAVRLSISCLFEFNTVATQAAVLAGKLRNAVGQKKCGLSP